MREIKKRGGADEIGEEDNFLARTILVRICQLIFGRALDSIVLRCFTSNRDIPSKAVIYPFLSVEKREVLKSHPGSHMEKKSMMNKIVS